MSEEGPSWWCTRSCFGSDVSGAPKTWFALFEFFPQRSQQHAFLRVSVCDGTVSQDALFNHDEIFSRYGYGFSSQDTYKRAQCFRDVIDRSGEGDVSVLGHGPSFVVEVSGAELDPTVRLTMKEDLNPNEFIDRVTKYMTYVDALVDSVHEHVALHTREKDELSKAVQKATEAKRNDDELLTQGVRILMKEKWDCWRRQ
ncbi:unnamed protein product [Agarophyton chilense]